MAKLERIDFVKTLQEQLQYPWSTNVGDLVEVAISLELTGEKRKWCGSTKADVLGYSVKAQLYNNYSICSNVKFEDCMGSLEDIVRIHAFDEHVTGVIIVDDAMEFLTNRKMTTLSNDEYVARIRDKIYFSNTSCSRGKTVMLKVGKTVRSEQQIMDSMYKAFGLNPAK